MSRAKTTNRKKQEATMGLYRHVDNLLRQDPTRKEREQKAYLRGRTDTLKAVREAIGADEPVDFDYYDSTPAEIIRNEFRAELLQALTKMENEA